MARFKESNILQGQFIAVNLSEQLIPGTLEWTLNYLIGRMDLSLFEEKYNNEGYAYDGSHPNSVAYLWITVRMGSVVKVSKNVFCNRHMGCEGRARKSLAVTFGAGARQPPGQINDLLATNSA